MPRAIGCDEHEILLRGVDVISKAGKVTQAPRSRSTTARVVKAVNAAANILTDAVKGLLILGTGDDLEELADHLTPDAIPLPAVVLQARRNAEWRAHVAESYGLLTAAETADLVGSTATTTSPRRSARRPWGRSRPRRCEGGTQG